MKQSVARRLHDALAAASEIATFVDGQTSQTFMQDRKLQLSLVTLVIFVGEALSHARRDDPSLAESIPEIHQIVGMRNRIVHEYGDIDYSLLWLVASTRIPELIPKLQQVLDTSDIDPE